MPPLLPGRMQLSYSKKPNQTNKKTHQDLFSAHTIRETHRKYLNKTPCSTIYVMCKLQVLQESQNATILT